MRVQTTAYHYFVVSAEGGVFIVNNELSCIIDWPTNTSNTAYWGEDLGGCKALLWSRLWTDIFCCAQIMSSRGVQFMEWAGQSEGGNHIDTFRLHWGCRVPALSTSFHDTVQLYVRCILVHYESDHGRSYPINSFNSIYYTLLGSILTPFFAILSDNAFL